MHFNKFTHAIKLSPLWKKKQRDRGSIVALRTIQTRRTRSPFAGSGLLA